MMWTTSGDHLLLFISCKMKKRRVTVLPAVTAPHAYTLWAVTAFKINPTAMSHSCFSRCFHSILFTNTHVSMHVVTPSA